MGFRGASGGRVEAVETYIGRKEEYPNEIVERGNAHKMRVVSLVDRDTGKARSFPANSLVKDQVAQIARANVAKETKLTTDEARLCARVGKGYASHDSVTHGRSEYVRGDVATNTVEGFFSIFKRDMRGNFQHCNKKHLHRYLAEFDFRYSFRVASGCNDADRADRMLKSIVGKRLTYVQSGCGA